MATTKEIKRRRSSIESTRQITRAMKLVATVKLQHTKEKAQTAVAEIASSVEKAQSLLDKYNNTEANV